MDIIDLKQQIKDTILTTIDANAEIKICDESHKHHKHKGYVPGKYHLNLDIKSDTLNSLARIKSHKEIYRTLDNLMGNIHALSIKINPRS